MIRIVGLGPGDWERTDPRTREYLLDPSTTVVLRTGRHPAAATLEGLRQVAVCDDLYESNDRFGDVYEAIAERVTSLSWTGDVIYAVPGSPMVGEFAVAEIRARASAHGVDVIVDPAESFVDAVLAELGLDPFQNGIKILDGHDLPGPLMFDVPTLIGHVGMPEILADVLAQVDRVLPEDAEVCIAAGVGAADSRIVWGRPMSLDPRLAGVRTSVFVPSASGGLLGVVQAMARLRVECPWDRQQTHESLVRYLIEESHEFIDALAALPVGDVDHGAYADVEEELGDVLLQVLFHAQIAAESGAFDISDVAEQLRRKLVRRHPHVFADIEADDADTVRANWEVIKADEKAGRGLDGSLLDGVPASLPGLARAFEVQRKAAKVGFDWTDITGVLDKVDEEAAELRADIGNHAAAVHELGDLLFSAVNVARHLDVDPDLAIRQATHRFEDRWRAIEAMGPIDGLSLDELDARWEQVKGG